MMSSLIMLKKISRFGQEWQFYTYCSTTSHLLVQLWQRSDSVYIEPVLDSIKFVIPCMFTDEMATQFRGNRPSKLIGDNYTAIGVVFFISSLSHNYGLWFQILFVSIIWFTWMCDIWHIGNVAYIWTCQRVQSIPKEYMYTQLKSKA